MQPICVARKNFKKNFQTIKGHCFGRLRNYASETISKFALYANLLKMEVVKLNRIKAVLAETDKQGKMICQNR